MFAQEMLLQKRKGSSGMTQDIREIPVVNVVLHEAVHGSVDVRGVNFLHVASDVLHGAQNQSQRACIRLGLA